MTVAQSWAFQQALYTRLVAQLTGQGPGGADVAVYDHVPQDPARIYCRIDGFNAVQRPIKCNSTQHFFTAHLFDRPESATGAARGQKTVKQLQATIVAALHDWDPSVTGASEVRHEDSFIAPDDDGLTQHAASRFSVYIAPS